MTRFKEQRRIDQAIKYKNREELEWAKEYCEIRLRTATVKEHTKRWKNQLSAIESVLKEREGGSF